jgi:hypothetical protein
MESATMPPVNNEREPGFIGKSKKKLSDATPRTKDLLTAAAAYYKCRLITDHPFPESKGHVQRMRYLKDAWMRAHIEARDAESIKYTQEAGDIVSTSF